MFNNFTDRCRKVFQLANREATRLGCEYIGSEHLLLGIVEEQEGLAGQTLRALDVGLDQIHLLIETVTDRCLPRPVSTM